MFEMLKSLIHKGKLSSRKVPTVSASNMKSGWIYAEGLTDFEFNENNQLLMAGHDADGRLMVAMQLSEKPFNY